MNDLRNVKIEFEAIGRSDWDRGEGGLELMRFGFAGCPVEHNIGRGNVGHLMRVRINRILPRIEWLNPNALIAATHQIPMPKGFARDVLAFLTNISNDHTDMCDRHLCHIDQLNCSEARIDEIPAREQDLLL